MAYIVDKYGVDILVDDDKLNILAPYKWYVNKINHACATINGKTVKMQNFLMNPPKGRVVDHLNKKTLDNRATNLEIVTPLEKQQRYYKFMHHRPMDENGYLEPLDLSIQRK